MVKKKIVEFDDSWLINDRYQIYKADGCIYDTKKAMDIPKIIFKWRNELINGGKNGRTKEIF